MFTASCLNQSGISCSDPNWANKAKASVYWRSWSKIVFRWRSQTSASSKNLSTYQNWTMVTGHSLAELSWKPCHVSTIDLNTAFFFHYRTPTTITVSSYWGQVASSDLTSLLNVQNQRFHRTPPPPKKCWAPFIKCSHLLKKLSEGNELVAIGTTKCKTALNILRHKVHCWLGY